MIATSLMLMLMMALAAPASPEPAASCTVTKSDYEANATQSFDDFDQKGSLPASARALVNRGCWSAAAKVTQHYLINGPLGTEGQQRILRFHLGQQLANAGEEQRVAAVFAGARNPLEKLTDPGTLRWNDFVRAHWAFFTKDQGLLQSSLAEVKKGTGFGNQLNAALIEGLNKCFDRPYLEAVSAPCRTPPPEPPQ